MMRRLLRIENLLLVLPLVFLALPVYNLYFSGLYISAEVDPGMLRGPLLMNMMLYTLLPWFFLLLACYLVHYFLRAINRRDKRVCFAHVIITVALIIYSYSTQQYATSVVPGWHTTIWAPASMGFFTGMAEWPGIFFWLVQAVFIAYGLFIIHRWRKSAA